MAYALPTPSHHPHHPQGVDSLAALYLRQPKPKQRGAAMVGGIGAAVSAEEAEASVSSRHWDGAINWGTNEGGEKGYGYGFEGSAEDSLALQNLFASGNSGSTQLREATLAGRRNLLLPAPARLTSSAATSFHDGEDEETVMMMGSADLRRMYGGGDNESRRLVSGIAVGASASSPLQPAVRHKDHTVEKRRRMLFADPSHSPYSPPPPPSLIAGDGGDGASSSAAMGLQLPQRPRVWAGLYGGERAVVGDGGPEAVAAAEAATAQFLAQWPLSPKEKREAAEAARRREDEEGRRGGGASSSSTATFSPVSPFGLSSPSRASPYDYHCSIASQRTIIGGAVYGAVVGGGGGGEGPSGGRGGMRAGGAGADASNSVAENCFLGHHLLGGGNKKGWSGSSAALTMLAGWGAGPLSHAHRSQHPHDHHHLSGNAAADDAVRRGLAGASSSAAAGGRLAIIAGAPKPPSVATFGGQQHQQRILEAIAEVTCSPLGPSSFSASSAAFGGGGGGGSAFVPPSLTRLLAVEAVEAREDRQKMRRAEAAAARGSSSNGGGGALYGAYSAPAPLSDAHQQLLRKHRQQQQQQYAHAFFEGSSKGLAAACEAMAEEDRAMRQGAGGGGGGGTANKKIVSAAALFMSGRRGTASSAAANPNGGGGQVFLLPEGLTPAQRFGMLRASAANDADGHNSGGVTSHMRPSAAGNAPLSGHAQFRHVRHGRVLARGYSNANSNANIASSARPQGLSGAASGQASAAGGGGAAMRGGAASVAADFAASASAFGDTVRSVGLGSTIGGGRLAIGIVGSSPQSPNGSPAAAGDGSGGPNDGGIGSGVVAGAPMKSLMALVSLGVDPERVVAMLER